MPRVVFTTCGTSLYNSSCWSWNRLNEKPLSGFTDRRALRKRQIECEKAIIAAREKDSTGKELADTFDKSPWDIPTRMRDLPAELASLKAIQAYFKNPRIDAPFSETDRIILLHSVSPAKEIDGKFCADVLIKIIVNNDLLSPTNIDLKPIANLDPADSTLFGEALKEIWVFANSLRSGGNSIILNLTGGYKALSILLGAFGRKSFGTPMFYLHEETGYDQIFMMKFVSERAISFSYFNMDSNRIVIDDYTEVAP